VYSRAQVLPPYDAGTWDLDICTVQYRIMCNRGVEEPDRSVFE